MKSFVHDTICAPATLLGTGAISIIRISGPQAFEYVDNCVRFRNGDAASSKGYRLKFGHFLDRGEVLDELLAAIFRAPDSYTGEDSVELYCHASSYIVERMLALLVDAGCRMAEAGEFTQRAFTSGKMDLAQAEAVVDVINASSEASHRVAMNQLRGGYSKELKLLRDRLLELASLMELELDFSEEEVEFADRSQLIDLLEETITRVSSLEQSFRVGNALRNGVPVAIVGKVNSGKSTLLNALVGDDRAIVSDVPGTTRDTVEETINIDGIQFRFIDTAGIRETEDSVERIGIERSLSALSKADVIIAVVDGTLSPTDFKATADSFVSLASKEQTFILVSSKQDMRSGRQDPQTIDGTTTPLEISAKTGYGLDELKRRLADSQKERMSIGNGTIVTSLRHYQALHSALESLQSALRAIKTGIPTDLAAEDLRAAIRSLSSIFGEITTDDLLGEIFGRFCIGK